MGLSKQDHLDPGKGAKRILALDGGGIRGILSLQFLKAIETLVRRRLGPDALLCDYFDLIGGTSTGSIIAAGLACGMTVDALRALYSDIGARVFQTQGLTTFLPDALQGDFRPKFPAGPLQEESTAARRGHDAGQRQDPHRPHDHDQASGHRQPVAP